MFTNFVPDKISFTFYKEEEILKMSVMEILQPLSLDSFGHPFPDGLCDPRMGPHNNESLCKTCNLSYLNCPGHFGHIKLQKPTFNPLLFSSMYSLLKSTCHKCGLIKISNIDRLIYYCKLELLKKGLRIDNLDYLSSYDNENLLCKKIADILTSSENTKSSSNFKHQELCNVLLKTASSRIKCLHCKFATPKLVVNKNLKISFALENNNQKIFNIEEILEIFKKIFSNEKNLMECIFSSCDYKMFFIFNLSVPPVKFRPVNYFNGRSYENPQNVHFIRILKINDELRINLDYWQELQAAILVYFDSSRSQYKSDNAMGRKQILEKKEGLFRRNIMGKRVNFAARSVISPDPNLHTREMGIPEIFAKKLTFPEKVNTNNYDRLRKAVINGKEYPGATTIQVNNNLQSLEYISHEKRVTLANQLLSGNKTVWRHLQTGDTVLVNRQPTLHKQSIMGHKVRVLKGEKTLRMHYVNCKPYNADFDGDEMNIHFPQSHVALSEAGNLTLNDHMYLVPTNGDPIRGLTQDHIVGASILTLKDSFFTKEQYVDLLQAGIYDKLEDGIKKDVCNGVDKIDYGDKIDGCSGGDKIDDEDRTYYGRFNNTCNDHKIDQCNFNTSQVNAIGNEKLQRNRLILDFPCISQPVVMYSGKQIASSIFKNLNTRINLSTKNKITGNYWKDHTEEQYTNIVNGELMTGILDKNILGPSKFSHIHACGQLYGYEFANDLLTYFGRVVNRYLIYFGFSVRIDDLLLDREANHIRNLIIREGNLLVENKQSAFINKNQDYIVNAMKSNQLDYIVREEMNKVTTKIINTCLPVGQYKKFPINDMGMIILTGAKGSMVNFSQISCCLGQQELEGRRVSHMISGKTLPCFKKFESSPSAGGYVFQRFLTGIYPPEYFFHCMAGREGLIDTAVKTSRSGYLQRCLIKHLEGVRVEYDYSVRLGNKLIQYKYGEDHLDCTKSTFLEQIDFFKNNIKYCKSKKLINFFSTLAPINFNLKNKIENEDIFIKNLCYENYINSLMDPGEAVGILAGQSIGEPSTQMTLNTFHLAGVGAKNVTLGIPRLREIIMVASKKIQTPLIVVPITKKIPDDFLEAFRKLTLDECIDKYSVTEKIIQKEGCYVKEIILTMSILKYENYAVPVLDSIFLVELGRQIRKLSKLSGGINILEITTKEMTADEEDDSDKDEDSDHDSDNVKEEILKKCVTGKDDEEKDIETEVKDIGIDETVMNNDDREKGFDEKDNEVDNNNETNANHFTFNTLNFKKISPKTYQFVSYYPADFNLMLLSIIKPLLAKITVKEHGGINKATRNEDNILLEGSNFLSLVELVRIGDNIYNPLDYLNIYESSCNDIYSIYTTFGVEAAREVIINEIISVFDVYGIEIDIRHLMLISDYMTRTGEYLPFNRIGLEECSSPLQKMSFESCFTNIKKASEYHMVDNLENPSACLTVGKPVEVGASIFDLLYDLNSYTC